ncbi:riboflavin synthase, alpha subunit, variant 1 [Aphanomyces astaci]|uniref:Riboflavin synthase n=1 Tax=Aphanomyces astaci TaxID=112090 RepID=W4HAZ7_APHAT|nr:riboflavin synthase, alpha subunit, variant 1 [Aphanomyces astaci]ETV89190.1 riboflavin synthase, alpha subunit, variant 1 [Aphanomyces astaci]|eukprot:XP_009821590.1 riboflavin synthase, alpha subunit, variant 1 [Aphanomyces astaci]
MLMGYMSLDKLGVMIMTMEGTEEEKSQARKVLPLLNQGHRVLVSILLLNYLGLEALPIWLNRLMPEGTAIVVSVTFVLFFGEILPSAIFTGKHQMTIAAKLAPLCHLVMAATAPLSYPIAKGLDLWMGDTNGMVRFRRNELKALISLQQHPHQSPSPTGETGAVLPTWDSRSSSIRSTDLLDDEVTIINSALGMSLKKVEAIMTPFDQVYMVNDERLLDKALMEEIVASGYSRIPVFCGHRSNIRGILLVKRLIGTTNGYGITCYTNPTLCHRPIPATPSYVQACWDNDVPIDPNMAAFHGVVTNEDVLEELIQDDFYDESDRVDMHLRRADTETRRERCRAAGVQRAEMIDHHSVNVVGVPRPKSMFTGIIEEIGTVVSRVEKDDMQMWDGSVAKGTVLVVRLEVALDGAYIGCSIAINGTCLTATDIDRDTGHVSFGCAPETLRLTNLRVLEAGDKVNVERAMGAQDRNSGHFVQGHVDGTGKILELTKEGESLWVKIQAEPSLLAHVVPKGFIAIDGTSLTVCEVNSRQGWFNVMLITHTQQSIVLPTKSVGDLVNLEVLCRWSRSSRRTGGG